MRELLGPQHLTRPGDGSDVGESKRSALIKSMSKRLRPVCSHMPPAEFDAMVRNMADIELKYADQAAPTHVDRAD